MEQNGFGVSKEGFGTGRIVEINVNYGKDARILVAWDDPSINGSDIVCGWYSGNELEFIRMTTAPVNQEEHLRQALGILEEFVGDVEKRGLEIVSEEWPELRITYNHAVEVLS